MHQVAILPLFNDLDGHDCAVTHVVFSQKGEFMVTADVDHDVVVWKAGVEHYRLNFRSMLERFWGIDRVRAIVIDDSRGALYIAAGGRLHALDIETGERRWIYAPPYALCFMITSPVGMIVMEDGNIVAVFDDGAMEMWSPEGKRLFRFKENDVPTKLIDVHMDNTIIGTDGFSVTIWAPESQAKVGRVFPGERIFGFAGSADDNLCATRTYDNVTIWDIATGSRISQIPVRVGLPLISFVAKRKLLAIGEEHRVKVVDYAGNLIADCHLDEHRTVCLTVSPDGTLLAAGCEDGSVKLFDLSALRGDQPKA